MKLVIHNPTSDNKSYISNSVTVSPNSIYEVPIEHWANLYVDDLFNKDILSNNIFTSDGIIVFKSTKESKSYLDKLIDLNYYSKDTDGAQIVRVKAAKKGWTYGSIPIEFKTAEIGSMYSKTADGVDRPGVSLKFFDNTGAEITTEGLSEINETTIIRSIVDFEPPYDYEVIGGTLRIGTDIAFDCRLWIIAVPDIAAPNGSKEMAGGINLKFLAPQQILQVDGRVSKTLTYNASLHTNKLRFIFEHQAGTKTDIHINIELFRP
jgi:hypothetical protein